MRAALLASLLVAGVACSEGSSTTGTPPLAPEIAQRCRRALDAPLDCIDCIEASCCVEAVRCGEDLRCKPCIQPGQGTECADPPPAAEAFFQCKLDHCADACPPSFVAQTGEPAPNATEGTSSPTCVTIGAPLIACDPITSEPCPSDEVCAATADGFACRPGGAGRGLLEPCGHSAWDVCGRGLHCIGRCARFCCADVDCGFGGVCDRPLLGDFFDGEPPHDLVGVCVESS